jgi:hypothetical protein
MAVTHNRFNFITVSLPGRFRGVSILKRRNAGTSTVDSIIESSTVQAGSAMPENGLELRCRQIENRYKLLVSTSCWALFEMRLFSCNSKETELILMV